MSTKTENDVHYSHMLLNRLARLTIQRAKLLTKINMATVLDSDDRVAIMNLELENLEDAIKKVRKDLREILDKVNE